MEPQIKNSLTNVDAGLQTFTINAAAGIFGQFEVSTVCTTDAPTKAPSQDPTNPPSRDPTPSPTQPQTSIGCGETADGDFNNEPVEVTVVIPYDGDMTLSMVILLIASVLLMEWELQ